MPALPAKRAPRKAAAPRAAAAVQKKRPRANGAGDEMAQARQQIEWQHSALQTIQRVALGLSSEAGLQPLLHKVVRGALDLMDAEAGSLLLLDPNTKQLQLTVSEGGAQEARAGRAVPCERGIAGWVFTHGEPLIVNQTDRDERFYDEFDKSLGFDTTNLVCVPLISTITSCAA